MTGVETGPILPDIPTLHGWAQESLDELRASSGYKTAKKQNPVAFPTTHIGKCEALLVKVVAGL